MQVDEFLKEHEVYDLTAADFEQDRATVVAFGLERLWAEPMLDSCSRRHVTDQLPHPDRKG